MKKCILIINPKSGKHLAKDYVFEYQKILHSYNYETMIYFTSHSKHATKIIQQIDKADLVISIGGDGTFNEIVAGNIKRQERLLLAHIPIGTTNDIGTMFGYKKDIIENLNLLMEGAIKKIDICTINKQPFIYVAGFGKFMDIPYETTRDSKSKYGYAAYLLEGVKSFVIPTKLYELTYKVDGKEHEGEYSFMLISNANRIAGINNFYKDVKLDDSKFEVIMCKLTKKADIVKSLYFLATAKLETAPGFEFHRVNKLDIKFKEIPKNAWCIDGEKLEDNTRNYTIEIISDINILMPRRNIRKLFMEK